MNRYEDSVGIEVIEFGKKGACDVRGNKNNYKCNKSRLKHAKQRRQATLFRRAIALTCAKCTVLEKVGNSS